jgi:hypothetical protein
VSRGEEKSTSRTVKLLLPSPDRGGELPMYQAKPPIAV